MADGYKIGAMATDTTSGRYIKVMTQPVIVTATSGYALQCSGTTYVVTSGKAFYPTGIMVRQNATVDAYLCYANNAALTSSRVDLGFEIPIVEAVDHVPIWVATPGVSIPAGKYFGAWVASGADNFGYAITGYESWV